MERADARVALIASGDLSHCLLPGSPNGYAPEGEVFDARVVEALGKLDVEALLSLDETLIHKAVSYTHLPHRALAKSNRWLFKGRWLLFLWARWILNQFVILFCRRLTACGQRASMTL